MKKSYVLLVAAVLVIVSCKELPLVVQFKNQFNSKENIGKASNSVKKASAKDQSQTSSSGEGAKGLVNSKYVEREFVGCLSAALVTAPITILTDAISKTLARKKKVDLYLKEYTLNLVKKDIKKYTRSKGKISPDHFWNIISKTTSRYIHFDMIESYGKLSQAEFSKKKQLVAYMLLYFLEKGKKGEALKFTFDNRDDSQMIRESVSYAGPKLKNDAKEVGICGYFRFTDVVIPKVKRPLVQCIKGKDKVELSMSSEGYVRLLVNSTKTKYKGEYDSSDMDFVSQRNTNVLEYDYGTSELADFKVKLNKSGSILKKFKLKRNRASNVVLKDLKCHTFKHFEYN